MITAFSLKAVRILEHQNRLLGLRPTKTSLIKSRRVILIDGETKALHLADCKQTSLACLTFVRTELEPTMVKSLVIDS